MRFPSIYNELITLQGLPTATTLAGISFTTTDSSTHKNIIANSNGITIKTHTIEIGEEVFSDRDIATIIAEER